MSSDPTHINVIGHGETLADYRTRAIERVEIDYAAITRLTLSPERPLSLLTRAGCRA